MAAKVYVGNLPYSTTEGELRTLFSQAGDVASIDLIKDRDTGHLKGFAFVTMGTQAEAQKAITMFHAFSMDDRVLKVSLAKPKQDRGPGGGSKGGKRRHRRRGGALRRF